MAQLHIDLREGFHNTHVVIRLNGQEVFKARDVKTRTQVGLARQVHLDLERTPAEVEIELPATGSIKGWRAEGQGPWFLAVDLDATGMLHLRSQSEPFGYL